MPKLSDLDPAIKALPSQLPDDFALPDMNEIVADAGGGQDMVERVQGWISDASASTYQAGGELGLAAIVTRIGVAAEATAEQIANAVDASTTDWVGGTVDAVGDLLGASGSLVSALAKASQDDAEALVKEAMQIGIGVSIQLMSQIPVVGWIAKLAWNFGNAIAQIVKIVKASDTEEVVAYPAVSFNPETDLNIFNGLVLGTLINSNDWTKIFMPPGGGIPANKGWLDEFQVANLGSGNKVYGVRIEQTNPFTDSVGYVPNTAFIHKWIEMVSTSLRDTGNSYWPTSRQHGAWIWEHIARHNSPALYAINARQLEQLWGGYCKSLRSYVEGSNKLSGAQKDKIVNSYNKDGQGPIFGWGKPRTHEGGAWIPDEDVAEYNPVKACAIVRERQLAYLNTITCAYVDDSFGAMKDPVVKNLWKTRRQQLLDHPAICGVDLSMIPDALYRGQVEWEQSKRTDCLTAPVQGVIVGGVPPKPPVVQGGGGGIDEPVNGRRAPPISRLVRDLALASGAVAAAGAAAYYFDDEIRRIAKRRRNP